MRRLHPLWIACAVYFPVLFLGAATYSLVWFYDTTACVVHLGMSALSAVLSPVIVGRPWWRP